MRNLVFTMMLVVSAGCVANGPSQRADSVVEADRAVVSRLDRVRRRVKPVAEAECRQTTRLQNCDYLIQLVQDRSDPPNAYQTITDGQPVLIFNIRLLEDVKNDDELAFIMGHEAAHYILGHLEQKQGNAVAGALGMGVLAIGLGLGDVGIRAAVEMGGQVGSRVYSKDFELQADRLGTVISARSGYDPVLGAEYFNRLTDPGDQFLGTHPPNPERIRIVRQTAAGL
ncbi:MAG: M48 family metalloprotease [Pseudoprimorskyibacter sp.]|nr:M48 family metalloprotease [Pseudoprimorskyibacter sp.]